MRGIFLATVGFMVGCSGLDALAQVGSIGAGLGPRPALPGMPAKEAFVIAPDGQRAKVSTAPEVRLHREVLGKPEAVEDILSRHNLANDEKTRQMLQSLNPNLKSTKGVFRAGSKVDLFTVTPPDSAQIQRPRYTFDTANLTRFAFLTQADRAMVIAEEAGRLPMQAFGNKDFASAHVQTTKDIQQAAETLQARSERLSKLDVAVAQYQVDLATKQAAAVNAGAVRGAVNRDLLLAAQVSAKAVKATAVRVDAGQTATDLHKVKVNVYNGISSEHVRPLQVYVIPSGVLEGRGLWTQAEVENYLNYFSFANEASPVEQAIPTNFDPRVCVGPKNAVRGMAQLVVAGKLTTCRKPDLTASAPSVLTFRSPEDVARP